MRKIEFPRITTGCFGEESAKKRPVHYQRRSADVPQVEKIGNIYVVNDGREEKFFIRDGEVGYSEISSESAAVNIRRALAKSAFNVLH